MNDLILPQGKKANRLKTSSMNNKMVNDYWTDVFNAKAEGKLVCWYEGVAINPLMQAADIRWVHGEAWSALLAARNNEQPAQTAAEHRGYMKELCSYARTHIGCGVLAQNRGVEASGSSFSDALGAGLLGERIPAPDMFISAYPYCSTGQQWDEMLFRLFGKKIPIFNISVPWVWGNKPDAMYLGGSEFNEAKQYMVKQIRACTDWIAQQTGKKYNWDKLSEIMSYTKTAGRLRVEAMELCKAKPAPASFFDWTTSLAPVNFIPGGPAIVDYFEKTKAEIVQRIADNEGGIPQEKYRLFWDGIMNWNKIGWLANKFAAYDANMVAGRYTHMGFWHEFESIDVENPLEGMAVNYLVCPINLSAPLMIEQIIKLCKHYEIEGVVLHAARTCRAFSNPQFLIADAVQKRLGLPVAMIEGDMVDESFYKDEIVNSRVEAMLESIEARKRVGIAA
ncbi:MAG: benzoyl-CoA reductase [Hydrocarboniphaga sp.]|uniref:2-hydroxyacyl-CoA dehydratase subunit D n=1 Tax=Hydrocarboniphaga sp. TaxID=2033016 RepID=UPI00260BAB94|nr:2-hydroxyacyl-CoA dehydratase family protein [Hydrocarboniphaga sp.]MDB5971637.1 benzoyl-CoA reductase [Hydrocarboniphaga sp.]